MLVQIVSTFEDFLAVSAYVVSGLGMHQGHVTSHCAFMPGEFSA